jgi:transposase
MKAYSQDLRERIVQAVAAGQPKRTVARTFSVSYATVSKYARLVASHASLAPKRGGGRPSAIRPAQYPALVAQLEAASSATLAEHVATWEKNQGVRVTITAMFRAIRRVGWTFKKRRWQPASKTPRSGLLSLNK